MSLYTYWRTRGLLGIGAAASVGLAIGLSGLLGFPAPGVSHPTLLAQPSPVVAIAIVSAVGLIGTLLGLLIAGTVRPDAGMFCAAFGLAALSSQSGTLRDALFARPETGLFTAMGIECLIFAALLAALQLLQRAATRAGLTLPDEQRDGVHLEPSGLGEAILALVMTAGAYALLSWFLLPTDLKRQALIGTFAAAFVASVAVHHLVLPRTPVWSLWAGVMLGAAACSFYAATAPGLPAIGVTSIPPARALPIDHASAGVAASILAYWFSRNWKRAADPETAPNAA